MSDAIPLNKVLHGDCVEIMNALPEGIVDVIFADPAVLELESGDRGDRLCHPLEGVTVLLIAVGRRLDADGTRLA